MGIIFAAGALMLPPAWLLNRIVGWLEGRQEPVVIRFTSRDFLTRLECVLSARGFSTDRALRLADRPIDLYAYKKIIYGFLPGHTHLYIIRLEADQILSLDDLKVLNVAARQSTNKGLRLPAWLRFVVPLTNTIILSEAGFPFEVQDYVRSTRFSKGGDLNDIYLVDLRRQSTVHSENLPSSGYLPLNVAFELLVSALDIARLPEDQEQVNPHAA